MKKYKLNIKDVEDTLIYTEEEVKFAINLLIILDIWHTVDEVMEINQKLYDAINKTLTERLLDDFVKVTLIQALFNYEYPNSCSIGLADKILKKEIILIVK